MKFIIFCITITALANSWQKTPIRIKNQKVSVNLTDASCSDVSNWLAKANKTNITIATNPEKISINWHNMPIKKAWNYLNKVCNQRTLKTYNLETTEDLPELKNIITKPSRLSQNATQIILWGTEVEHKTIKQLLPKSKAMLAIKLKWLIMDDVAEQALGLDLGNIQIQPKTILPTARVWQLVNSLKDWQIILNSILNDLKQTKHILSISEPYLLVKQNSKSSFQSNIIVPNIIKTSRSSYTTMQNLPIDMTIVASAVANKIVQLEINSHMHNSWDDQKWPKAIHALSTKINLELNSNLIIAKQRLLLAKDYAKEYGWLGFFRNNQNRIQHEINLYVMVSAEKLTKLN